MRHRGGPRRTPAPSAVVRRAGGTRWGAAGRSRADGSVFSEGREASGGGCGFANCPLAVPRPDPGRRALAGHSPSEPRGGGAFPPPPAWAARAALVYAAWCGFLPPPSRGLAPRLSTRSALCLCVCARISSLRKDSSAIRLVPTPVTACQRDFSVKTLPSSKVTC